MLAVTVLALIAIAVPFLVYPLVLWARARWASEPVQRAEHTPPVDLVICAFNEAEAITAEPHEAVPETRLVGHGLC